MALALYRTYRPGTLEEVIGQDHVTEPLQRALAAGRVHHAYLLSGPRGCGKTSTARILARSLNCETGPTAQPCGQCRSCVELAPNGPGSMDVVELDAATHRGIDDARDLREKAVYAPAASRFKVYIIDEAHQLTNEAANALLKLVEEPPPHLRFIFATTEPDKIIPTIRSRTFHYGFRLVPARVLAEHLAGVCRSEGVPAEPAALTMVARAGAGSVRDSLSVLGQLLAGSGDQGLTYVEAVAALGLTDAGLIDSFVAALASGSAADMFGIVETVISGGHDPRRFVIDVLDRLRDLIVLRVDPDAVAAGLVDVPEEEGERLADQAAALGLAQLSRAADLVSTGLGEIKGATAPRLQLELLCARLALPDPGVDPAAVLARLERLEQSRGPSGQVSTDQPDAAAGDAAASDPTPPPAPPSPAPVGSAPVERPTPPRRPRLRHQSADRPTPGPEARPSSGPAAGRGSRPEPAGAPPPAHPEQPTDGGESDPATPGQPRRPASGSTSELDRVRTAWPAIMDKLAGSSRVAWTAFHAATPLSCGGGVLAVAVSEPGYARAITQRGHDERLRQAIIDVLAMDVAVDVVHDPEPSRPPGMVGDRSGAVGERLMPSRSGRAANEPPPSPESGAAGPGEAPSGRADQVRAAGRPEPSEDLGDDASPDDPDADAGASGLQLIERELGAHPIGEIDHS